MTESSYVLLSEPPAVWSLPAPVILALAELGRLDQTTSDISLTLTRLMAGGAELLPDLLGLSVTVGLRDETFTVAASSELVAELDGSQYVGGDGPCLTELSTRSWVRVPDLAAGGRWPVWRRASVSAGVRSLVSVPVGDPARLPASINAYAASVGALDGRAVNAVLAAIAAHATVLLANLDAYGRATQLAQQLAEAMNSRAVLEQAKSTLMGQLSVDHDTARAYLVRLSQDQHIKAVEVATTIVRRAGLGQPAEPPGPPVRLPR